MKNIVQSLKFKIQKETINRSAKFVVISLLLLTFNFRLLAYDVSAQQVTLSLDPPIVQAKIKPGKSILIAYTVENKGDPLNLQFLIRPFEPVGQQGSLTLLPQLEGPIQFNLENADVVLEKPFFFASKEKRQAVVRVFVPQGIPDGDYYYMLLAETVPAFSLGGQSAGVASASLGSPLLISVTDSGITQTQAQIAEFSFHPDNLVTFGNKKFHIVDSSDTVSIVGSIRNMGIHLLQPGGTITHQFGSSKNEYSILPQNILSNSQRILKVSSEQQNVPGTTLSLSSLSIGSHAVRAAITFGEDGTVQYKELTFIALPIRFMKTVGIAIGFVLSYFLIQFLTRKKSHKHKER